MLIYIYFIIVGYTSIVSSRAIHIDLTPPAPGYVTHVNQDYTNKVDCKSFVPPSWQHRCASDSPVANMRYVEETRVSHSM